MRFYLMITVALMAALVSLGGWAQIADNYETHNWEVGYGTVTVDGYNATHVDSGSQALQTTFTTAGGFGTAVVDTDEFLTEVGTGLTTGFTARVYCAASGGVTGVPAIKIETTQEDNGAQSGGDTTLTLDAWTDVTLPAGSMTEDYKRLLFVFVENGATGDFNIWIDNIQREGAMWDDCEGANTARVVPANIEGTARGERTLGGSTISPAGPAPLQGSHCYGITWTGDTGDVEIQHFYSDVDLSTENSIVFSVYVPSGTTLPTMNAFFYDGTNGSFQGGSVVTANDVWEPITINISGIHTAAPFDDTSVDEVKIVCQGAGAAGTIYVDQMYTQAEVPVELSIFTGE